MKSSKIDSITLPSFFSVIDQRCGYNAVIVSQHLYVIRGDSDYKVDFGTYMSYRNVIFFYDHNPTTTACALNRNLNWKAKRKGICTFFLVIFYIV